MAAEGGLDQSLFQRLVTLGNHSFMLNKQYRMHPFISQFSRIKFYDGLLEDGITEEDRQLSSNVTFQFPNPEKPIFFVNCKEEEQVGPTGLSYLNRKESSIIGKLVFKLLKSGFEPHQIGIITPYEAQRSQLRTTLQFFGGNFSYDKIEVASINAYQGKKLKIFQLNWLDSQIKIFHNFSFSKIGREKDIIILSTVRSNQFKGIRSIGFLRDARRLNVGLTRAKYGGKNLIFFETFF